MGKNTNLDPAALARAAGRSLVFSHPLFSPLSYRVHLHDRKENNRCPENGWGVVTSNGGIHLHPKRRGEPEEWGRIIAHLLLHLGFGQFKKQLHPHEWNVACNIVCNRFLQDLKFGKLPDTIPSVDGTEGWGKLDEVSLYNRFVTNGVPAIGEDMSPAGPGHPSMEFENSGYQRECNWQRLLAHGMSNSVSRAVEIVSGARTNILITDDERNDDKKGKTNAQKAMKWIIERFPLIGGLAASFTLIEDTRECIRRDIGIAAISVHNRELYINPAAGLSELECRLVLIHELLHAGLEHNSRRNGRDPFLWNAACDFVINGWLMEMGIGSLPSVGFLHDPKLKGKSAEEIYVILASDIRRSRKLVTFRGREGLSDMLPDDGIRRLVDGRDVDTFCRQALAKGLEFHVSTGRGTIPAGLEQEIRALMQPPIPWDVELARWFDIHFPLPEKRRSYARPSRRQEATPDIPRPRAMPISETLREGRVFGVVLDTSGSMNRELLGKALGAIASYAYSHEVSAVRVVFCDAEHYDAGYMMPEEIAGRVRVKGRGGTVLQPGVDFLLGSDTFPKDAPVLIITDTECDKVSISREHAWLIPNGRHLPFHPSGPVFNIS